MRAGFRCSMPGCRVLTVGPSDESPDAVVNVGVAAHIHAAAPNGRRYDPNMTPEDRKNIRNGIWLCATHSVEIDRDDVRYTPEVLRRMKYEHERFIDNERRAGGACLDDSDLVAIGPNIVVLGELLGTSAKDWSIRIDHFVHGDLRTLIELSERFDDHDAFDRYLLVNALGEGRQLAKGPSWRRDGSAIELTCTVKDDFPRVDARRLGAIMVTNGANDLFIEKSATPTLSGLESLPQRIKVSMSMLQGESPFHPKAGSRIKEYFEEFEDSLWLQRWVKLEVVRMACVPYDDRAQNTTYTLIPSVLRVYDVEALPSERVTNWRDFRFKLDVQGIGPWEQVIPIFVPQGDRRQRPSAWDQLPLK